MTDKEKIVMIVKHLKEIESAPIPIEQMRGLATHLLRKLEGEKPKQRKKSTS